MVAKKAEMNLAKADSEGVIGEMGNEERIAASGDGWYAFVS